MRLALIITCLLFSGLCAAQPGYAIQFKIDGLRDTTAFLGYYFGESTFIKDTAKVNSKGEFTFEGKQTLPQGGYFLVLDRSRIFDIVVGSVQRFSLETKFGDYISSMKVKNDPDNKLYFENMAFIFDRNKEVEPFLKIIKDSTLTEDQKKEARAEFSKVTEKVLAFQEKVIAANPGTVTARMLKATRAIKVPEAPKKPDGSIDSAFQLRWYREHFFDNFDLSDEAMMRLPQPMYSQKVNEFLDKLYVPQKDTLWKAVQKVIGQASKNQETYKYSVWLSAMKFQQPEIMGLDEVYVLLYDKYFASGQMDYWATPATKKTFKEHADRLRKSLVGRTGDNLIMQDANFKPRSMYDIKNKYTILFIFDPDCGHCREETPKLVDFYSKNKTRFNVEVFAVSSDTSMKKMRDYIKEMKMPWITVNGPRTYNGSYHDHYDAMTTPSLYILDDKKKIIAKKIPIEKMEEFFTNFEKFHKPGGSKL